MSGYTRPSRQTGQMTEMPMPTPREPERLRPTDEAVSHKFSGLARHGTRPELLLRRELHARGRRYRVNAKLAGLPRRKADIVFPKRRVVVFVDGCFWHGCPNHFKMPARNPEWWAWKIAGNRARDLDTDERLAALGWRVIRIWEHVDPRIAADTVETILDEGRTSL